MLLEAKIKTFYKRHADTRSFEFKRAKWRYFLDSNLTPFPPK